MAVKICEKCGESNHESAHICVVCGKSLKDVTPEGTLEADKKYDALLAAKNKPVICRHCHEENEPDALTCKVCGSLISRTKRPKTYLPRRYEQNRPDGCAMALLFIATFLIPLVGLIIGGIFLFSDDVNKRDVGKGLMIFGIVMILLEILLFMIFL